MTILNAIRMSLEEKRLIFISQITAFLLAFTATGCVTSDIYINRDRSFDVSQIRSIAFLHLSKDINDCAKKANKALKSTLLNYFKTRNIKVVEVPPEWVHAIQDFSKVTGEFNKKKAREIGKIFEADSIISGSISECNYYNPNVGDGLVKLTVKIYDTNTGDMLTKIDGKKIAKSYDSGSISQMTSEVVNAMFTESRFY